MGGCQKSTNIVSTTNIVIGDRAADVDSQSVQGDDGRDEDGGHNHVGDW